MLLKSVENNVATRYWFECPGCQRRHQFIVRHDAGRPSWTFDGNFDAPTFAPSLLNYVTLADGTQKTICHLFVRGGQIEYCGDCPHEYAGKTIPMIHIGEQD